MSIHFSKESISARPDSGYYSPEKLAILKRIFDKACKDARITDKSIRDSLASKLLGAGRIFDSEDILIEFIKKAIAKL